MLCRSVWVTQGTDVSGAIQSQVKTQPQGLLFSTGTSPRLHPIFLLTSLPPFNNGPSPSLGPNQPCPAVGVLWFQLKPREIPEQGFIYLHRRLGSGIIQSNEFKYRIAIEEFQEQVISLRRTNLATGQV